MAWQTTATNIIRILVSDLSETEHSDESIEHTFVICAHMILRDLNYYLTYTVDVVNYTISPDPSSDVDFINLCCLYAASILVYSELKTKASSMIRIKDGPSEIDLTGQQKSRMDLYNDLKNRYEKAKFTYISTIGGKSIVGPYTTEEPPIHNFF